MPFGLGKGLRDRIKNIVDRYLRKEPAETEQQQAPTEPPAPADTPAIVMQRIREAARTRVQLYAKYDNVWRYLEPYSFRYKAKESAHPLFYARCSVHPNDAKGKPFAEAFRIDRFQDMYLTDKPYVPTWTVEID